MLQKNDKLLGTGKKPSTFDPLPHVLNCAKCGPWSGFMILFDKSVC